MVGSSLAKKLVLKPGNRVLILNHEAEFQDSINALKTFFIETVHTTGRYDAIIVFVNNQSELERITQPVIRAVTESTIFWIAYPKASSGIQTDITRDKGWESVTTHGMIPVSQVSVDEKWSALRFRHVTAVKKITRGSTTGERKDLKIPADFLDALSANHLLVAFEKLAFTHRKEYICWIEEAKKEDTRIKRVAKAVIMIAENKKPG